MPKIEMLKTKMEKSGLKITSIAEKAGISRETLYNRLNGCGEFKASEITSLTIVLNLSKEERDEIFLT